jgi:hypothetical protein
VLGALISLLTRTKVTDSAEVTRAMRADMTKAVILAEPRIRAPNC